MSTVNDIMLQALQNAKSKLNDEANHLIKQFIISHLHHEGGFVDRNNKPDLYYSVFGYSLSLIYDIEINTEKHISFLKSKQNDKLDLVHAVSLIRCYLLLEAIKLKQTSKLASIFSGYHFIQNLAFQKIVQRVKKECAISFEIIREYQSLDGGYNQSGKNEKTGTIYAAFLVWSLMQDIDKEFFKINASLDSYKLSDGSFGNELNSKSGITTTTAAGLVMSFEKSQGDVQNIIEWLNARIDKHGGFNAGENVPVADVLSTATALTALKMAGSDMKQYFQTINFINLHWDTSGGFFGSIADMHPDIEYTFYALLSLGMI